MTFWYCPPKTSGTTTSNDNDFDYPNTEGLIGLWDFNDGFKTVDTGLSDGIAQNGHFEGGAYASDGALKTDGNCDFFDVSGEDAPFDLDQGTIMVEFTQAAHVGSSPDVIVNRGEFCDKDTDGYFNIQVTADGRVQLNHYANGEAVTLSTDAGFFDAGDDVRVAYSWDVNGQGTWIVENVTDGTSYETDVDTTGLDMDVTDNDDENFTFAAREYSDGSYDQYFNGEINYVAIYDRDVIAESDGIVSGTDGDDLIDLAYTGDPDGDMIDNGDAILPGEAADDDIVEAGAGDDVIKAGLGDDEIYGDKGATETVTEAEVFQWSALADQDPYDSGNVDNGDDLEGLTLSQDTGSVTVSVTTPDTVDKWYESDIGVDSEFSTRLINTDGADGAGSNSSLESWAKEGETGQYDVTFSEAVENVVFNVSDIDANKGQITVLAYDADGNAVPVSFDVGSGLVHSGSTVTAASTTNVDASADSHTLTATIAGPVAKIEIIHTNVGTGDSGVYISDITFDAITGVVDVTAAGNDEIWGGVGSDTIYGEGGDDTIVLEDGFGNDVIVGGETGETDGDTLDATLVSADTTVVLSDDPEAGTITDGTDTATFAEIENILLGSGDDTVLGGAGDDSISTGTGADTVDLGAGNDTADLGDDTDVDTVIFSDGDGSDTLVNFTAPETLPDGTVVGHDQLDVSGLTDAGGDPVNTDDVTVSEDTDGNAVLTFPNGESLTLVGVPVEQCDTPEELNAMGIPLPPLDGIVSGTAGDDLIDVAYTGDPDGDMVDAGDAILPGEFGDDDIIEAGDGNDTVLAGEGNDEIDGGAGDDTIDGGDGDDVITDTSGSETVDGGAGNDVIDVAGGDSPDTIAELLAAGGIDALADLDYSPYSPVIPVDPNPTDDIDTVIGGAGDDTIITGDDADYIEGGAGNDTIYSGIDDDTVLGGDGNDYIEDVHGADTIDGGAGDDTIIAGFDTFSDYTGDDPNLPSGAYPFAEDQNTLDGQDTVYGGAGNDTIYTGDDADFIDGGDDDDYIDAGIDDDNILGGAGNDTIFGGHGQDVIYGGDGNDYIDASDTLGVINHTDEDDATDPLPDNDMDEVHGGAGDDTILGGDDADVLYGDDGNDTIDGGIDNDEIHGGEGSDVIFGGDGDDFIDGGLNADTIDGGAGDDTILGGNGKDTIFGGDGNDVIDGGTGEDYIDGGAGDDDITGTTGDDTILGGDGDDVIVGGLGEDHLEGGLGADLFLGANAGDVVIGGEGPETPEDIDVLDLTGMGPLRVIYDDTDPEAGIVEFRDGSGNVTGTMEFSEIENVIPCFTPGTTIATPKGERLVEELQVGDKVITRDNGIQEIRWVGAKAMDWKQLALNPHLKPILVRAGSLGDGLPERDMMVSPNHRMLVANDKTALYFEEREVLAASKHLVNNRGIHEVEVMGTTYIHFMFDQHEVVLSNGCWTESFQPGDYTLKGIGNAQRNEIFELFPELREQKGIEEYTAARRTLKRHEARLLVD